MSKRKNTSPKGDYEVGYGRPPRHTQFKKGEKQNHTRRRREDHLGGSILEELSGAMAFADEEGRRRKLPKMRVLAKQMVNHAVRTGDPRRLEKYLPKRESEAEEPFTDAELATIARFLAQFMGNTTDEDDGA
jgi:hypothetical protein